MSSCGPRSASRVSRCGLALAFVLAATGIRAAPERPNIVFVMVDDLGPEWIGCYGADDVETPAIDRLAAAGMRFTAAYSMPKCTPTRATLLTGQYPFRHGWVNHWDVPRWGAGCHFDPKHNTTFARLLKKAGYATAIAGKWQINDFRVQPDVLREHGFDEWCMWTGFESGNKPSANRYWDPYIHTRKGSKTYEGRFGADVFTDFLIDFMTRNRDRPLLVYFPMALTHGPLVAPPNEPKAAGALARHKAMVRYVDAAVGRLVGTLDRLAIRKKTFLFFSTDNGTGGGITGHRNGRAVRGGKGRLTETGCCEPFIVSCPGSVPAGKVSNCITDFTDLLPTFCELAGVDVPENLHVDGKSIASVLLGKSRKCPRSWILAMGGGVARINDRGRVVPEKRFAERVIRDGRFKILAGEDRRTKAVFDLEKDPAEERNLIESRAPDVLAARRRLEAVLAALPEADAAPRYDPTPPQPWDRKPRAGRKGKRKK